MHEDKAGNRPDEVARMLADAVLPEAIRPQSPACAASPRLALLTGACGFLGRQVARELLRTTDLRLICLARDKADESAAARVARIFAGIGISPAELEQRVEVRVGDVALPDLGLDAADYADLAGQLDAIYHCAALVDWVRSYRQLYRMNVGGVLNMIRLACHGRAKRLLFVSSIAVCYARGGPERIDEDTDMLPCIGGMPLGYARSKCVAEALLRQAAARGVPVSVLRPALIAGDAATGESSPTDLIAALIQGCVASGMAMDTDWLLDCVPVDFVARVMARTPQGETNFQVLNLMHARPRHWRELILWMNLHGYRVDLVASDDWIRQLFDEGRARGYLLYPQRRFFSGVAGGTSTETRTPRPYEAYLADGQRRIDTSRTRALLRAHGLHEAALDTDLLHAYFAYYRRAGVLPRRAREPEESVPLDAILGGDWQPEAKTGVQLNWLQATRTRIGGDDGLLSEIAAARLGGSVGLWRLEFDATDAADAPSRAVLKAKVDDRLIQDLTVQLAGVCSPELGRLFGQYRDALGLAGCHERELALHELDAPGLRRHMPACLGIQRNAALGRWALLLEYLPEAESGHACPRADAAEMATLLNGLAAIHAFGYRREAELAALPWLTAMPEPARMLEMTPLWRELADFAAPWFVAWCGEAIRTVQADCIASLDDWWPRLRAMPASLIHNDFNPRNLVLRQVDGHTRLCAYDWELATLGAPQHDLAELLCFTWHGDLRERDLSALLDAHRDALAAASGQPIDALEWRAGFALALRHLLINRLAMYTLMHRFRPLAYLPEVMRNWLRLHAIASRW